MNPKSRGDYRNIIQDDKRPSKRKEATVPYKFEIYKDKKGEFRFRLKAPNGKNMFASEGYKNKPSAMKTIESIKKNAASATVDEQA
jgi:uncharacterized protein YegP (UPF0339 family)